MTQSPITYEGSGVNYAGLDPLKITAQRAAVDTTHNLPTYFGYDPVEKSRGELAYVWDEGDRYGAIVTEGLGTKNLVADARSRTNPHGPTHYDQLSQDTVAMIVNDLITVGAMPKVVTAHWSVASDEWFKNQRRVEDLTAGWAAACNLAGATWGGGETPALKGILQPGVIELSGTAVGEIRDKYNLVTDDRLRAGDAIVVLGSSGIHANGLTLAREVANRLPEGYETTLSDGRKYGDALLTPTPIYVPAVRSLQEEGIIPTYMANITGHGWRKFMRATQELTYRMFALPKPQAEFDLIQKVSGNDLREMYGNFNMGAGYAFFLRANRVDKAVRVLGNAGFDAMTVGEVEAGAKRVILEPIDITYSDDAMHLR